MYLSNSGALPESAFFGPRRPPSAPCAGGQRWLGSKRRRARCWKSRRDVPENHLGITENPRKQ